MAELRWCGVTLRLQASGFKTKLVLQVIADILVGASVTAEVLEPASESGSRSAASYEPFEQIRHRAKPTSVIHPHTRQRTVHVSLNLFNDTWCNEEFEFGVARCFDHPCEPPRWTIEQWFTQEREDYGGVQPDLAMREHLLDCPLDIRSLAEESKESVGVRQRSHVRLNRRFLA